MCSECKCYGCNFIYESGNCWLCSFVECYVQHLQQITTSDRETLTIFIHANRAKHQSRNNASIKAYQQADSEQIRTAETCITHVSHLFKYEYKFRVEPTIHSSQHQHILSLHPQIQLKTPHSLLLDIVSQYATERALNRHHQHDADIQVHT